MTWLPYYDEASGRHYLHLGGAYSYSGVSNHELQFSTAPELQLIVANNFEPIFLNTGLLAARQYQLLGTEVIWTEGPWSVQSEYVCVPIDMLRGPTATLQGAYVMGSYFLTGEHRPYDRTIGNMTRVLPFEDFFRGARTPPFVRREGGLAAGGTLVLSQFQWRGRSGRGIE